jgi:hypothetical protein
MLGWTSVTGRILQGIYTKSKSFAAVGLAQKRRTDSYSKTLKFTNLLQVVSSPSTLLLAYREIRGNKGALTQASEKEFGSEVPQEMLELAEGQMSLPDGITFNTIKLTSKLLRTGRYFCASAVVTKSRHCLGLDNQ